MAESILQFEIDDDSPTITYYPNTDTYSIPDYSAGWLSYYTISGFAVAPGESGEGNSYHLAFLNSSSLLVQWNGTGIDFLGNATNASYEILLDGSAIYSFSSNETENVLASLQNLNNTGHTALLTVVTATPPSPDSFVAFDQAVITYAAPPSLENYTSDTQTINDTDIAFLGQWTYTNDDTGSYAHVSTTAGDRAEVTFQGSALTLYGLVSAFSGAYTVTLDNVTKQYTSQSSYNDSDALLFFASGLSEEKAHSLSVTNQANLTFALRADGINVTAFGNATIMPSDSTSTDSNVLSSGTIAAIVLGAVIIVLLVAAAAFFFLIYRPRLRRRRDAERQARQRGKRDMATSVYSDNVLDIRRKSVDEDASVTLSTGKGYGFGLGFAFSSKKGHHKSKSSEDGRDGDSSTLQVLYGDEKRHSTAFDVPVLPQTYPLESEKLAPGWSNPIVRSPYSPMMAGMRERVTSLGPIFDETASAEMNLDDGTLTSSQDEYIMATLSLSPRTSDLGGTTFNAMRRHSLFGSQIEEQQQQQKSPQLPSLQIRESSPFRVDINAILGPRSKRTSRETRRTSGSSSRIVSLISRSHSAASSRKGTKNSRDRGSIKQEIPPSPSIPMEFLDIPNSDHPRSGPAEQSFIDWSSSASAISAQGRQNGDTSPPQHNKETSHWSYSSIGQASNMRSDIASLSHVSLQIPSMKSSSQSPKTQHSSPFPFPVAIPPSPHIPHPFNPMPVEPPPETTLAPHRPPALSLSQMPSASNPASPTDSIPLSVSDIQFRHTDSEDGFHPSRRTSTASHLPPHPPLPYWSDTYSPPNSATHSSAAPYIVQRVLGLTPTGLPLSPTSRVTGPRPLSSAHTRVSSAPTPPPSISPSTSLFTPPFRIGSLLGPRPRPANNSSNASQGNSGNTRVPDSR